MPLHDFDTLMQAIHNNKPTTNIDEPSRECLDAYLKKLPPYAEHCQGKWSQHTIEGLPLLSDEEWFAAKSRYQSLRYMDAQRISKAEENKTKVYTTYLCTWMLLTMLSQGYW